MKKLENSGDLLKAAVPDKGIFKAGMYTIGSVYRWFWDQVGSQECALARERNADPILC
jgi:hypothetical protein